MWYSTHPDVHAFVQILVRLLGWIELKKTNRTAIHAFHMGPLHLAIERMSQFLHVTTDPRLRISLLAQKRLGKCVLHAGDDIIDLDRFDSRMQEWRQHLPPVPPNAYQTIEDITRNDAVDLTEAGNHHQMFDTLVTKAELPPSAAVHYQFTADVGEHVGANTTSSYSEHMDIPRVTISLEDIMSSVQSNTPETEDIKKATEDPCCFRQLVYDFPPNTFASNVNNTTDTTTSKHLIYADYDVHNSLLLKELAPHASWNSMFAPLYIKTHTLFDALQTIKEQFHMEGNCPKYTAYAEIVIIAFIQTCKKRNPLWTLRHVSILYRMKCHSQTHHTQSPVNKFVRTQFKRMMIQKEKHEEYKRACSFIEQASSYTLDQLIERIIGIYVPLLFHCTISATNADFCEWVEVVRTLVTETDSVIRADIRFRENLMDNISVHVGGT